MNALAASIDLKSFKASPLILSQNAPDAVALLEG
jgi:hypothetical protein